MGQQRIPQIGEDVTALMPSVGDDVTALMGALEPVASHEPAQEDRPMSSLDDAWQRTQEPDLRGRGAATLPAVGGTLGGVAGGPGGAAIGGATGALVRDLIYANRGDARVPKGPVEAAGNVGLNAAAQGALAKGGEVAGRAVGALGRAVTNRAVPLVRSALKPAWAEVRRRAGIEGALPADVADQQAQFIVDKQLRTPDQADTLVKSLGSQIDEQARAAEQANPSLAIDSAQRVPKYLHAVLQRIEKQLLPGKDRAAVQNVGRELVLDSPLSRQTTAAERAQFPQSSRPRDLRSDVKPTEALELVRNKSFYNKDASGGELAGGKAIERAVRHGVREAVPSTAPLLKDQGRAMDARTLLDRAAWRDANRDQVGMGGMLGLANSRPTIGLVLQLLKEGQLGAGLAAGKYGPKMARTGAAAGVSAEQLARLLSEALRNQNPTEPPE